MNRRLVLTSEGARHPFRRSLPPHVLAPLPRPEPEVLAAMARAEAAEKPLFGWDAIAAPQSSASESALIQPAARRRRPLISSQDVKHFAMAYCACFLAVSAFIS